MVQAVARVYEGLSPAERARCAIFCDNYGEAGAIHVFGPAYGLPRAISGHNSYYLWGPGEASGEVVIAVGLPVEELQQFFDDIEVADRISHPYAMPYENDLPVHICRGPKVPANQPS